MPGADLPYAARWVRLLKTRRLPQTRIQAIHVQGQPFVTEATFPTLEAAIVAWQTDYPSIVFKGLPLFYENDDGTIEAAKNQRS
jgi:hypothetical protein